MKKILITAVILLNSLYTVAQIRFGRTEQPQVDINYAQPKEYEIGGITVSGIKYLEPNALIAISGLEVGDKINLPGEEISSAIKKLWDQGLLADAEVLVTKIEGGKIFLDFNLKERPRLAKFEFKGAKKSAVTDLKEKIGLNKGKIVTDALIKNTQNIIRKYYVEKGFLNAKVYIAQKEDSILNNSVTLVINVDRNNKVKINKIEFVGNQNYSAKQLRKQLKETKQKGILRFFKPSKFMQANFEKDKAALISFYNKQGYRDAAIVHDTVYAPNAKDVNINIKLEEGQKYYFRNITWKGNFIYDDKTLADVLNINKGDVYNTELLERKITYNPRGIDISSLYMDDGYLTFHIEPVEVSIDGDSIDVEMRIYEGQQFIIDEINIAGNTKTHDHVILREIYTLPGQKFSRDNLIRTQRELSQLGYFDPEQINLGYVPDPSKGTVNINYSVVERPSDQIELSGGWGGYFGFVGTLGLTFNNFAMSKVTSFKDWNPLPAGDGQRFSMRAQANGKQYQQYSLSFTEPWLGGKRPNAFTVGLSHSVYNNNIGGFTSTTLRSAGRFTSTGVNVSLGRRLKFPDNYFTLLNALSLQRYELFDYKISSDINFDNGPAYNLSYSATLSRNSINNPTFPSSGSNISLTVSATPPYSLFRSSNTFANPNDQYKFLEYHKWMFDASWFLGLDRKNKLVINTRAHMGFLGQYNDKLGLGPFERFKLGGSGITGFNFIVGYDIIGLRGYNDNSIGPKANGVTGAGIVYNKFVTELRYAVSTNPAATIFLLTFIEGGNNWGTYRDYNPFNIYRAAGAGVRIFMPAFGMIGFDMGKGFDGPESIRNPFTFTIGQQIR